MVILVMNAGRFFCIWIFKNFSEGRIRNMKRIKILTLLCVFILATCTGAWGANVAKIGSTEYKDLKAALAQAKAGDTITLTGNDETSFTEETSSTTTTGATASVAAVENLEIKVSVTIDGGGNKLDGKSTDSFILIKKDSTAPNVTIKNLTFTNFGSTGNPGPSDRVIALSGLTPPGTVTLENVKFEQFKRTAIAAQGGTLILNKCTITGDSSKSFQDGIQVLSADVTINDTTITGIKGTNDWDAGCLETTYGVDSSGNVICTGNVTINSGTFTGEKHSIIVSEHNAGTITIKGGDFTGALLVEKGKGKIVVSGGTFSTNISADIIANGYHAVSSNGKYKVVSTALATVPSVAGGELSYSTSANTQVSLATVLDTLSSKDLGDIRKISIDASISEVSNATLKKVTLTSLDLTQASALTTTKLDLSSVSVDNVIMAEATAVTNLELDSESNVKNISAPKAMKLKTIALNKNKKITNLNLSGTGLTALDASECASLDVVNISDIEELTSVNVSGCVTLRDFNCSSTAGGKLTSLDLSTNVNLESLKITNNRIAYVDLSNQKKLKSTETSLGGQKSGEPFTFAQEFYLWDSLANALFGGNYAKSALIAADITAVREVNSAGVTIQEADYDEQMGRVKFAKLPTGSLRYIYDTKATFTDRARTSDLAYVAADANEPWELDMTLSAGTAKESKDDDDDDGSNNGSGGGCEVGSLSFGLVAALMAFMKRRRA